MIYPSDFENKIGFVQLRIMLDARCLSDMGRRCNERMAMITDRRRLITVLRRVDEMKRILESGVSFPISSMSDPSQSLAFLKAEGGHISAESFAQLSSFLRIAGGLKLFFSPENNDAGDRPELTRRFQNIPDLSDVVLEIDRVVNQYGQVRDNASELLADIRRKIASATAAMNGLMRRVMDAAVKQGIVSADATPSIRDGHLVIPVAAANKKAIPGIVFDQSATGRTFFIEPVQIVEANNTIKEYQLEERKEIIEILTRLSAAMMPFIPEMEDALTQVGEIDFIRAKAILAVELDGQMPSISKRPELDWFHAVHPGLALSLNKHGRNVVPLDIRMDDKQRIVVISGPNAGGKSVCLKTIAIVQYMMQCGLLPTLYSNSHMGVFTKILIDIGDEQSIENDLSTYSSHLRNMKMFLTQAGPDTLFLADEMGSGTEPQIGGAIAQAILSKINEHKAFGVVTTHYQNLKTFANETPGLVNAAMLYDRQHLQPLFKLSVGTPGSSFALDIARKSGIPADVIDEAKQIAGSDYVSIDKYLLDLARDKKYWADKRLSIKEKEHKLDRLSEEVQAKADEIKAKRGEIIAEAKAQARKTLESANAKIESTIREIRAVEAEKEKTKMIRRELEQFRSEIINDAREDSKVSMADKVLKIPNRKKKAKGNTERSVSQAAWMNDSKPLATGDYVKIPSSNIPGKIISISGNKAEIAIGALRTYQPIGSLKRVKAPKVSAPAPTVSVSTSDDSRRRQLDFKNEIDVRGMRVDEALQTVTYFLDDAMQFQASKVRILHGTGTGALRVAIRQLLKANQGVESFHDEDVRLGGAGITVVNLL